ncbi:MAG: tetratricopeptide repeat protein [Proteobacteria bacterium]|nr:tetratricopeptide repeat protein [Pseudomonadota bacterium]
MNDTINPILQAGFGAHQDGELDIAAENYRYVLKIAPDNADALHLLGLVALQKGDPATAVESIQKSLAQDPGNPQGLDHLGTALLQLGDLKESVKAFESALTMAPDFAECWFNLGNAREEESNVMGAIDAYIKAIELYPDFSAAHANLGNAYIKCQQFTAALAALDTALKLEPALAPAWLSRGNALRGMGHPGEAIEAYTKSLALEENGTIHCLIADCHHDLDQDSEAQEHFRAAITINASDPNAHIGLGYCLIRAGANEDCEAAEKSLDAALSASPGHRRALAYKTVLLNLTERLDEARHLADFERDIAILPIPAPAAYENLRIFNKQLAAALCADPSLTFSPENKTTRGGRQSGELVGQPDASITEFYESLKNVLDGYLADISARPGHPQFNTIPAQYRLESWSTILDADGHQLPHIHPTAWLSGVYYVAVPGEIAPEDPTHQGWLEFGASGYGLPDHDGPTRLIPPQEGHMVVFPSYFFHRTLPFQSNTQRISIAFDLVPTN